MRSARLPLLLLFASPASALTLCRGCSFATVALPRSLHIRAAEPTPTNEVEPKRGGTQTRWNPQSLGYGWSLLSLPFTFTLYLSGSSLLDSVLVQVLGFNRASGDAFGPFVTLLGLIYSILLGQIYEYYFNRQGVIQDALYQEISALSLLSEVTDFLADRYDPIADQQADLRAILHAQATQLLQTGLSIDVRLQSRSSLELLRLIETLDRGTASGSAGVRRLASRAVSTIAQVRSQRISAIAAELPPIQTVTQRVITAVVLLGFVLVDLGAPKLEALLFSVTTACFVLINIFLEDLSDPFSGSWNVDAARAELKELVAQLKPFGVWQQEP